MERLKHEPPIEPPDAIAMYECSECGEPIYCGDRAIHLDGWGWICETCIDDLMQEVDKYGEI